MRRSLTIVTATVLLVWGLANCGTKQDPVQVGDGGEQVGAADGGDKQATWTGSVKPLIDRSCANCHASTVQGGARNGAPTGVNLGTYDEVFKHRSRVNARIQAGTMPPSGGMDGKDRALIQSWVDQGAPGS